MVPELTHAIAQQRGPKLRAAIEQAQALVTPETAATLAEAAAETLRSGSAEPSHSNALAGLFLAALRAAPDPALIQQYISEALKLVATPALRTATLMLEVMTQGIAADPLLTAKLRKL